MSAHDDYLNLNAYPAPVLPRLTMEPPSACFSLLDQLEKLEDGIDTLIAERDRLAAAHELIAADLARVASILATFCQAPITISALQPVLDLALEFNPGLKPHGKR